MLDKNPCIVCFLTLIMGHTQILEIFLRVVKCLLLINCLKHTTLTTSQDQDDKVA